MITLALNVIVGAGEQNELESCLSSVCGIESFLDEIVVTVTTKDPQVEAVARKYTDNVHYFKWIEDFGAARAYCQRKTVSEYILWLDADDYIPDKSRVNFGQVKKWIDEYQADRALLAYHLDFDPNGIPTQFGMRDKIYRRVKYKWEKAVHEQLVQVNHKEQLRRVNIKGCIVEHRQMKISRVGLERNIRILERKHEEDPSDPHYLFYLARDLSLIGKTDKSIEKFDYIIKERIGNSENLYLAAYTIASCYLYNEDGSIRTDVINEVDCIVLAENYARMATSFSEDYAEPFVLLGDIYYYRGLISDAVKFYKIAMSKGSKAVGFKQTPFYEEIPCERLSKIFARDTAKGNSEQALYYITMALKHSPEDKNYLAHRKKLLNKICEGSQDTRGGQ